MEDNNSIGSIHNTHILIPSFYALHRAPLESIDRYWNRFNIHLRNIRRDPNAPTLTHEHTRLQFLITLGGVELDFLKRDWENSSLDKKWLQFFDGELKSALRLIQQAKMTSRVETVASNG